MNVSLTKPANQLSVLIVGEGEEEGLVIGDGEHCSLSKSITINTTDQIFNSFINQSINQSVNQSVNNGKAWLECGVNVAGTLWVYCY